MTLKLYTLVSILQRQKMSLKDPLQLQIEEKKKSMKKSEDTYVSKLDPFIFCLLSRSYHIFLKMLYLSFHYGHVPVKSD